MYVLMYIFVTKRGINISKYLFKSSDILKQSQQTIPKFLKNIRLNRITNVQRFQL